MGGTFLIKSGKVHQHIMPDFSKTPLNSEEDLNNWLKFYNMSAPLVAVGAFVTRDYVIYHDFVECISLKLLRKIQKKLINSNLER